MEEFHRMTMKNVGLTMLFAFSFGFAATVNAARGDWNLRECCRVYYSECVLNYGEEGCVGVFEGCVASNHCVIK